MNTEIQIRNYLGGRMESGLLLIGTQTKRMLGDAALVASSVLSTEAACLETHPDFLRVKSAEGKSLGVNDIMPILSKAQLQPAVSDRQVVVIEGFDKMSVQAQNKLLKLIEESELLVIGIADEDKLLPTIKSRMRVVVYSPMPLAQFKEGLSAEDSCVVPRYFASKGNPDADIDGDVLGIFCRVLECVESNTMSQLFDILSLTGEKDSSNFYSLHRAHVPSLISLIGKILADKGDSRGVALCKRNRERCAEPSYTNNDFILFVTELALGGI